MSEKSLTPKYANVKIPHTSPASKAAQRKAQKICIKEEIKHLYKKKKTLNKTLYKIHLQVALEWGNSWNVIQESILDTVNQEFEKKYKLLDNKISRLAKAQNKSGQKQYILSESN